MSMADRPSNGDPSRSHTKARKRHASQLKVNKKHSKPSKASIDGETPLTEIRKKIRSLEKLLIHDAEMAKASLDSRNNPGVRSMPSHIRQEKERALAGYKHDLQKALSKQTKTKQHSKMISKYHRVRFFERIKAERLLKKEKKLLEQGKGSEEAAMQHETDLNYALYLPLNEAYVSLWPRDRGEDPDNARGSSSWKTIQSIISKARTAGVPQQEMDDQLLKIRDNGWASTFGMESLSVKPGSSRLAPKSTRAGTKNAPETSPNMQTSFRAANMSNEVEDDHDMDEDSDGFFEK